MLRVTTANVAQQRTIRPLYAQHQATPYACFLDPTFNRSVDILPGMAVTKLADENVTLMGAVAGTGTTVANHKFFGLAALFVAPALGIDELRDTGINTFAAWRGGPDATFEILAPAFAVSGGFADVNTGGRVPLRVTQNAHADGPGKLTPEAAGANVGSEVVANLIDVVSATKIVVSLDYRA